MGKILQCGQRRLDLSKPVVMGILNVTPDSFSDGGCFNNPGSALRHAFTMQNEGAAIIDIGGESTRPGAESVSVQEELDRVIPVIEAVQRELDMVISIDTNKPEVMRAAAAAGAGLINDVYALRQPGALAAAVELQLPVCLMHMQGIPGNMQQNPEYIDVVAEVDTFLRQRVSVCREAGLAAEHLLIDPGFGFGKNLEHNLALMQQLDFFKSQDLPLLVGVSRKRMISALTGADEQSRLIGSVTAALTAVAKGANIIRVHDVKATVAALAVQQAMLVNQDHKTTNEDHQ